MIRGGIIHLIYFEGVMILKTKCFISHNVFNSHLQQASNCVFIDRRVKLIMVSCNPVLPGTHNDFNNEYSYKTLPTMNNSYKTPPTMNINHKICKLYECFPRKNIKFDSFCMETVETPQLKGSVFYSINNFFVSLQSPKTIH